jgi:hypothetical protein
MTHDNDEYTNVLERALLEGYRSRSDVSRDLDVTQDVMREIRRVSGERSRWVPTAVLDQLVWRTATITAAVVLVAIMVTVGFLRPPAWDSPTLAVEELEAIPLFGD